MGNMELSIILLTLLIHASDKAKLGQIECVSGELVTAQSIHSFY